MINRNKFTFANGSLYVRSDAQEMLSTEFIATGDDSDTSIPQITFTEDYVPLSSSVDDRLSRIIRDQGMSEEEQRMFFAMVGRLLFDKGQHDSWNLSLHIHGEGGSGKTEILRTIRNFFDPSNVLDINDNDAINLAGKSTLLLITSEIEREQVVRLFQMFACESVSVGLKLSILPENAVVNIKLNRRPAAMMEQPLPDFSHYTLLKCLDSYISLVNEFGPYEPPTTSSAAKTWGRLFWGLFGY